MPNIYIDDYHGDNEQEDRQQLGQLRQQLKATEQERLAIRREQAETQLLIACGQRFHNPKADVLPTLLANHSSMSRARSATIRAGKSSNTSRSGLASLFISHPPRTSRCRPGGSTSGRF